MDSWLKYSLIAAAFFVVWGVAVIIHNWLEDIEAERELQKHFERSRKTGSEFASNLPEAMQRPPNMGDKDIPYRGPNYFAPEDVAADMKGLKHYGTADSLHRRYGPELRIAEESDLSFSYRQGHVAPDGTIWRTPQDRISSGIADIPHGEVVKAARFGWKQIGYDRKKGRSLVQREEGRT